MRMKSRRRSKPFETRSLRKRVDALGWELGRIRKCGEREGALGIIK